MRVSQFLFSTVVAGSLLSLTACGGIGADDYDALTITAEGEQLVAQGVIDGSSVSVVRNAIAQNPQAKTLILQNIPGSADDVANLKLARMVRDAGLRTVVPSDGMVASGGTDLFLAGTKRRAAPGACIGVHSWATGGITGVQQATDFPRDDPEHQKYLSYYAEMGIPAAFYWYTLEAAPAESIHWMTAAEVNEYRLTTSPAQTMSGAQVCDQR